tara:strand:+ start:504 stop:728 length:225 start_codon:yes stop_codon:yes gene_type:complete
MEKTKTITINNEEYELSDLDEQTLYYVNQVRDLKSRIAQSRFVLDQLIAAEDTFGKALVSSLNTDNKEKDNNAS